jgi:hypothetical protein
LQKEKLVVFGLLAANFFLGNYETCINLVKTAPLLEKAFKRKGDPMYIVLYPVQTNLPKQDLDRLDRTCDKLHLSRYEFVRQAIKEKIENVRKNA